MASIPRPPPRYPARPEQQPEHHPDPPPTQPPDYPPPEPEQEPEPEEKVLEHAEAKQLFLAGHRLKKKGDPPEKWFCASRLHGLLVVCHPMDEEFETVFEGQELVLLPD
jgi:hypothetical protein